MKHFLFRMLYAVICVVMFLFVFPRFLAVVGFNFSAQADELIRILVACIAVIYVLFGGAPPEPF